MAAELAGAGPGPGGNGFTREEMEYESVNAQNKKTDIELAVLPPIDVDDHILYGRVASTQCRIVAQSLNESVPDNCQNSSLKEKVGLKYDEEECSLTKDILLNTVSALNHFKNYSNNTVKMESVCEANHSSVFEDQQRLQDRSLASEETLLACASHPRQHSCNIHILSSFLTQHRNPTLLPLDNWTHGEKEHHVRMIPVLRQLVSPVAGVNNYICYEPWKEGMLAGPLHSPDLPASSDEYCDGLHPSSQSSGDDCAEVKLAVASIMDGNKEQTAFHDPSAHEMSCKLRSSQERLEESICLQRSDSSSLVFCHLNGNNPLLCFNNPGARELKTVHIVPQYQGLHNSLQSCTKKVDTSNQLPDIATPLPALLGRCLPVPGTSNLSFGQIMSRDNTILQVSSSSAQQYASIVPFPQIKSEDSGITTAGLNNHLGCSLMAGNHFPQLHNGALQSHVSNAVFTNLQGPSNITLAGGPASTWDSKSKKPCNCTKSQCLKLYCDCFANGEFCSNCNCNNCYNNMQHELERFKAIKACLDRNPEAFQPKIGKGKLGDIKPRHNKGCNCKRSGCLKNYCECYEAKIMCSSICKCIGCKNYEESPDRKTLMSMPQYAETERFPLTCISWEVVEATCACLLAQGEEAEKENYPISLAEQMILEEFGRCLSQILYSDCKTNGLQID